MSATGEGLRIMLVGLDDADRALVRRLLAESEVPFEVEAAAGSEEVPPPHVVELVADDVRRVADPARAGQAPWIVLARRATRAQEDEALRAGAADYLVLDEVTPRSLERAIRHAVARSSAARALHDGGTRFARMVAGSNDAFWEWDLRSDEVWWSERWSAMLGRAPGAIAGTLADWEALVHPEDLPAVRAAIQGAVERGEYLAVEYRARRADGSWAWIRGRGNVVERDATGRPVRAAGANTDVTPEKLAEEAARRTNRALRVLSAANGVLVRANEEGALFQELCRVLVELGGYRMAWVGLVREDGAVVPAAVAGHDDGYVAAARITCVEGDPRAEGPAGRAIRSGLTQRARWTEESSATEPWRAEALARGYRATLALPIATGEGVVGSLQIHASMDDAFDPAEVQLLEELARDIGFGVETIRARAARAFADRALRDNEARFRAIFEDAGIGIALCDESDRVLDANEALASLLRTTRAELIGASLADATVDEDRAETRTQLEALVGGRIARYLTEKRFVRRSGEVLWVRVTVTTARREAGTLVVKMVEDVNDRKRAEEALQSELRKQQVVARLGLLALEGTDRGRLAAECTRVLRDTLPVDLCGIFARTPGTEELRLVDGSGWATVPHVPASLAVTPDGGAPLILTEPDALPESLRLEGARCAAFVPIHGGSGGGVLVAAARHACDRMAVGTSFLQSIANVLALAWRRSAAVVELEESHRRLETALERLRQAQDDQARQERLRALGQMASGIAHDFNNHLTAIAGFTELLLEQPELLRDPEKSERYVRLVNVAAHGGAEVVKRLREFYRTRDREDVFTPVDVNAVVKHAIALAEPKWRDEALAQGRTIAFVPDLRARSLVLGVEGELRDSAFNLILNAIDAMPSGGTITLRTFEDGDRVVLEVADDGTGMTEEVRRRCMEPFFTTKGERGTGLGLAMVWGIVERHGGTVDIRSQVGAGTTVSIRLPSATTVASTPEAPATAPTPTRRILVVDDEPTIRELLETFLAADGHVVASAPDGRAALDALASSSFDVVFTDRSMPNMSGDQLAAAVRSRWPDLPIVMITGFGDLMEGANETVPGVDMIVGKPITLGKVRDALRRVVPDGTSR